MCNIKTNKLAAIILLFCVISFVSCEKEYEPPLPELTHTGANTFGCRVNGKVIITKGKAGIFSGGDVSFDYNTRFADSIVTISASNFDSGKKFDFTLSFRYQNRIGLYEATVQPTGGMFLDSRSASSNGGTSIRYKTNSTHKAIINITFFYPGGNDICAGTFTMSGVSDNGQEVNITDGRFDIGR